MSRRAWAAFVTVAILWGVPYLFIRIAVADVSPVVIAWVRVLIAAVVLLPFAASRGGLTLALKRWRWVLLLGAYYMALAWTLIPLAERALASSLTAIIIAGVPIVVTVMDLRRERPALAGVVGLLVAFVGVAVLVGLEIGVRASQLFALGCLVVVLLCYAVGPIMTSRKLGDVDPVATSGLAAGFAALLLTPFAAFQPPNHLPSAPAIASLAVLGLFCSAVALVAWFTLLKEAGPGRASIVIYLNPAVAVLAGALVLREHIGPPSIAGMVLILAGSWLATRGRVPAPARAAAA